MANTIYGLTNYYNAFVSPVKSYQVNPVTNLMYGSVANKVYSQTFAKRAQSTISSYLTSMNTDVSTIKTSAKALTMQRTESSFNKKAVDSSDSSAVSGTAAWNADLGSHTINVSKLAKSQINKGKELKSNDSAVFNEGLNTFTIKSGSTETKAAFIVNAADTNRTALDKMAASINKSKSGITASVVSDAKSGTSYLKLNSNDTGTDKAFQLTDTIGNSISTSGANTITDNAQNAEYILDGKQYTSKSNTININNNKAQLTLKKADSKDINISIGNDISSMKDSINQYINDYNNIVKLAARNSESLQGASDLGTAFSSIINTRKNTLSNIGITINSDNTLQVDDKKLSNALKTNLSYVKDVFSGYNGIAEKTYSKANEVLLSPLKYTKTNLSGSSNTDLYSSFFNTGSSSNISQLYSGMLFDMTL